MTYVLYGDKGSGAFCAEAALCEADADYEFQAVSLKANEQKEPAFLAINPSGKMPALKLPQGGIVTESAAILLTIADRHPHANLFPPPGSFERAQAYRWIAFMAGEIYPMVEIEDYPERFASGAAAQELKERALGRVRERLLIVERNVAGPWMLASGFSAADIYAAMFSRWSVGREWRDANLPRLKALGEALGKRPKLNRIWQRHFGG